MTNLDFNNAEPQKTGFGELIPNNTTVILVASLRPGGFGPGGWLKNTKAGDALMADFEFTIDGGSFDRRKVWGMYVVDGETEGQKEAAAISRSLMRAMLESAFGIDPADDSPGAMERRQVSGWEAFDGLRFCGRLGIQRGELKDKTNGPDSERFADKNILREAVTVDNPKYMPPGFQNATSGQKTALGGAVAQQKPKTAATSGGTTAKPSWAS